MTTYFYACDDCQTGKEVEHRMSECDSYACACPQCGERMHRVPQAAGVKMGFRAGYFPQLEKLANGQKSEWAHVSSERELHDKASRMGFDVNRIGF